MGLAKWRKREKGEGLEGGIKVYGERRVSGGNEGKTGKRRR